MSNRQMVSAFPTNRLATRVVVVFIVLYSALMTIILVFGVGENAVMKWLAVTQDIRVYFGSTISWGARIAAAVLLPAFALRMLGVNPRAAFFPARSPWARNVLYGFMLTGIVLTALFVVEVSSGWLIVLGWNWQAQPADAWLRIVWVSLLVNASVAIGEETAFRGYLLTGLQMAWGKWPGLATMTVLFGLFHLPAYVENGMQSMVLLLGIVLATLFGAMFGLIYLHTGSLWLPISLHFAWNLLETDLYNLSGELSNPNLIGVLTRLSPPLSLTDVGPGNVVVVEGLAFALIAIGAWLWLGRSRGILRAP